MPTRSQALVLLLGAQPQGTTAIGLDEEVRSIRLKLREAELRDQIRLESYWAAQPDDLLQALNQHRPDVLHFSVHGTESLELLLSSPSGRSHAMSDRALSSVLRVMGGSVRALVLNSCFSLGQARDAVQHVDVAVGMRDGIRVDASIQWSQAFYSALGYGRSFREAFDQAALALEILGIPGKRTPVLCVREGLDAERLFLVAGTDAGTDVVGGVVPPELAATATGVLVGSMQTGRDGFVLGDGATINTGSTVIGRKDSRPDE